MIEPEIIYERNFDTLLLDSVDFLFNALEVSRIEEKGQSASRASITFSLLILEAVANTCIEHLELESTIQKEIDKLPVLSKFDFYLRTQFRNKKLERGVQQVAEIKELKSLRDGLVHLKKHKLEYEQESENTISAEIPKTKSTQIPYNPRLWESTDAVKVSKSVHSFLNYFFKDKCKYTAIKVTTILFSESKVPEEGLYVIPCLRSGSKKKLKTMGIDLGYIKING